MRDLSVSLSHLYRTGARQVPGVPGAPAATPAPTPAAARARPKTTTPAPGHHHAPVHQNPLLLTARRRPRQILKARRSPRTENPHRCARLGRERRFPVSWERRSFKIAPPSPSPPPPPRAPRHPAQPPAPPAPTRPAPPRRAGPARRSGHADPGVSRRARYSLGEILAGRDTCWARYSPSEILAERGNCCSCGRGPVLKASTTGQARVWVVGPARTVASALVSAAWASRRRACPPRLPARPRPSGRPGRNWPPATRRPPRCFRPVADRVGRVVLGQAVQGGQCLRDVPGELGGVAERGRVEGQDQCVLPVLATTRLAGGPC